MPDMVDVLIIGSGVSGPLERPRCTGLVTVDGDSFCHRLKWE
jgi:hypothetical protein